MKCPRCGAENNEGARFCKDCGETFVQSANNQPEATQTDGQSAGYQAPPVQGSTQPPQQAPGAYQQPPQGGYQPPQGAYQPPQGAYQPPQGAYQQPGQQPYYGQPQMPPPGPKPVFNMTSAIFATIFGFLCSYFIGGIFGIIAITKGNRTDSLWAMGDYQGAYNAAAEGNKYLKISWIVGAIGCVLSFIYGFITALSAI